MCNNKSNLEERKSESTDVNGQAEIIMMSITK